MLSAAFAGGYLLLLTLLWSVLMFRLRRPIQRNRLQPGDLNAEERPSPVSVCVPVRDEATSVESLVHRFDDLSCEGLEVVVVNDNSTDDTMVRLKELSESRPWLRCVEGGAPPEGWSGKAWAMHRGAAEAEAETLLFLDVDVELSEAGLLAALAEFNARDLQLLSLRGETVVHGWGQGLIVPGAEWLARGAVDLDAVNARVAPEAYACEAFVLVDRAAYEAVGGFAVARDELLPATGLARVFNQQAKKVSLLDAPWAYRCGRKDGLRGRWARYRRRLYQQLGRRPPVVFGLVLFTLIAVLFPFVVLMGLVASASLGLGQPSPIWLSWTAGVCTLVIGFRWVGERESGRSGVFALLHPLGMTFVSLLLCVSFLSVASVWKGRRFWDGRVRIEPA